MKVKQFIGGVAAFVMAALCAQGAQAQMGPWTGLYLGVNAGYGWSSDSSPSADGFLAGLHAGYNWQFGSALLGVEGDYTFSGMESGAATAAAGRYPSRNAAMAAPVSRVAMAPIAPLVSSDPRNPNRYRKMRIPSVAASRTPFVVILPRGLGRRC